MDKVGIITQFHNSLNYGGVLQAYALCRALKECGVQAEQICYQPCYPEKYAERKPFLKRVLNVFTPEILWDYICSKVEARRNAKIAPYMEQRRQVFQQFGKNYVPQSDRVFRGDDMHSAGEAYGSFITGSDQVWNLDWYQGAYFLDFVPEGKRRISYATSLGMYSLSDEQKQTFQKLLSEFTSVSVREEDAVGLLQPVSAVPVVCTLDPTLLLSREQWDEICGENRIHEPYLFCYFLGENRELRRLANEYAHRHGLKIVTIPHATGIFTKGDGDFGDEKLWGASPSDFLSLIKYADCIFTNSFHAAVFSGIYQKQYFVFPRKKGDQMVSRIYTLTGYFGSEDHFCDTEEKCSLSYMENVLPIQYDRQLESLQKRRAASFAFLQNSLAEKE